MTINGIGNNGGDPKAYCDSFTIQAKTWHEAQRLATLLRMMSDEG